MNMIFPYKNGSNSVKNLKGALAVKEIKREGSKFKGNPNKFVINWGATKLTPEVEKCKVINNPKNVATASNKLSFFEAVKDIVSIPEFTTNEGVAMEWLEEGAVVLARTKLNGHSGEGINIFEDKENLKHFLKYENVPLYVKYIPKKEEYRVHVVNGEIIDVRRKVVKKELAKLPNLNWKIRSYHNGFIFQKNDVKPDPQVLEEAVKAILAVGLDFGAVDVIWNNFRKKAYVLEINTAPGLEGSSVEAYKQSFEKLFETGILKKKIDFENKAEHKLAIDEIVPLEIKGNNNQYVWVDDLPGEEF